MEIWPSRCRDSSILANEIYTLACGALKIFIPKIIYNHAAFRLPASPDLETRNSLFNQHSQPVNIPLPHAFT